MKRSKAPVSRREEIHHIYQCYSLGLKTLPLSALLRFLHREQMEDSANQETGEGLIDRYEIDETARVNRTLTFEGFLRYMESMACSVFDQSHRRVYQDMGQPLCHYFISSSHNTYLTGDQLVGRSHLDAYVSALRKGCRCLEIDCWDGPDLEPVVYHGHTLTSKILFKDVVATVEEHAFQVSPFPVILSLENHCSKDQQVVMAQYLTSILGDKLLSASLEHINPGDLPSPNDLRYKILVKNKKLGPQSETQGKREREGGGEDSEDEEEDDEEEEDEKKKKKKKGVVVAEQLSDLVIYTRSVKFHSFQHSQERQSCDENTSVGEKKARKLVKAFGSEFVLHNARFLSRIYPAGSRTSSSNYNPQEFWNVGSQLVALNYQSPGRPMDLNNGRFQDNGGCGYVLKPPVLRANQTSFDPNSSFPGQKPTHLLLKVISGSNLPVPWGSPFVRVEIHGVHSDSCRRNTDTDKNNSLSPHWDAAMNFTIAVPELCLLRFCVRDRTGLLSSDFVGQYTLPFSSLNKGYRWVPLLTREGYSLDPASLFIFLWY
ncbi:1-phosphatidylinositol 4,5-bisphosphate phosphodiesterase zeta-1-like [Aplochiton taeniatus]